MSEEWYRITREEAHEIRRYLYAIISKSKSGPARKAAGAALGALNAVTRPQQAYYDQQKERANAIRSNTSIQD